MTIQSEQNEFPSYEELYSYYVTNYASDYVTLDDCQQSAKKDLEQILNLLPPVKEEFLHWWKTGSVTDNLDVNGYKISHLLKRGFPPFTAFICFNDLCINPKDYFTLRLFWDAPPRNV